MLVPNSGLRIDDPAWPLLQALISYWGVATANGNVGGTTLLCDGLILQPSYTDHTVKMITGNAAGQTRTATHVAGTNTITTAAWTDNAGAVVQTLASDRFIILNGGGGGGGAANDLVTSFANGAQLTVLTTEHFLSNVNVAGTFKLVVDKNTMAAGDTLEIRVYQMVVTAGTARLVDQFNFYGAQAVDDLIFISPEYWNDLTDAQSLRFSITQPLGAVQTFPWKVLQG